MYSEQNKNFSIGTQYDIEQDLALKRRAKLALPFVSSEAEQHTSKVEPASYDDLFRVADGDDHKAVDIENAAVRPVGATEMTDASILSAHRKIIAAIDADPGIAELFNGLNVSTPADIEVLRTEIANNQALRFELLRCFEEKFKRLAYEGSLPDQLQRNGTKNPNKPIYERFGDLKSREYASLLGLAKLDGSFDPSNDRYDPVASRSDSDGGQHRRGADMLFEPEIDIEAAAQR